MRSKTVRSDDDGKLVIVPDFAQLRKLSAQASRYFRAMDEHKDVNTYVAMVVFDLAYTSIHPKMKPRERDEHVLDGVWWLASYFGGGGGALAREQLAQAAAMNRAAAKAKATRGRNAR